MNPVIISITITEIHRQKHKNAVETRAAFARLSHTAHSYRKGLPLSNYVGFSSLKYGEKKGQNMKLKVSNPASNRDKTGKFKRGYSGNPKGRRQGILDKRVELRRLLEPSKEKLVRKAISLALAGEVGALKLCLERLIPVLKPTSDLIQIDLPAGSLTAQAKGIFESAISGKLSADDAAKLNELLMGQLKIAEVDSLQRRIEKIEAEIGGDIDNPK